LTKEVSKWQKTFDSKFVPEIEEFKHKLSETKKEKIEALKKANDKSEKEKEDVKKPFDFKIAEYDDQIKLRNAVLGQVRASEYLLRHLFDTSNSGLQQLLLAEFSNYIEVDSSISAENLEIKENQRAFVEQFLKHHHNPNLTSKEAEQFLLDNQSNFVSFGPYQTYLKTIFWKRFVQKEK